MGITVRLHAMQAMGGDAKVDSFADTTASTYLILDENEDEQGV